MSARLNILMLIPELGFGGAERSFLQVKRMLETRHNVLVVTFGKTYQRELEGAFRGPEFHVLDAPDAIPRTLMGRLLRWHERFSRLRDIKRKRAIDVSISFLEGADMLNVLTHVGEKTIVSVRGSKLFDPHIQGTAAAIRRWFLWPVLYRRADAVVAVSAGVAAEIDRLGFVGRGALNRTIGLALRVSELATASEGPVEPQLAALAGKPVVISWGRVSKEKGYQHLVRIFAKVREAIPEAKLLLIGDGPLLREMPGLCSQLGLRCSMVDQSINDAHVVLTGYRDDPIRYAKLATLFVLPSHTEGFPNALVEALIAGIPVFANDGPWGARSVLTSAAPEVRDPFPTKELTATDYGVLMPRIDDEANDVCWADGIAQALRDPQQYRAYQEPGRRRADAFDVKKVKDSWLELVTELHQAGRRPWTS